MWGNNSEQVVDGQQPRPYSDGSSLLIQGLPSGPRPYEEVLTTLRKGALLEKYGRHGPPKKHKFRLSPDYKHLEWESKGGRTRRVALAWIRTFKRGQSTDVFKRYPQPSRSWQSFSIIYAYQGTSKERSLDLICNDMSEFEMWYWGVQVVKDYPPHQYESQLEASVPPASMIRAPPPQQDMSAVSTSRSLDTSSQFSRTPRIATATGAATSTNNSLSGAVFKRLTSSINSSSLEWQNKGMGDVYVWGSLTCFDDTDDSLLTHPQGMACTCVDPMHNWQQSRSPLLVYSTDTLNVMHATCGTRHAAIISRAGELYTWGYGRHGALGHGNLLNSFAPQRVEGRWVQAREAVQFTAASDTCTAAITSEGKLYTWGSNLAGQLGHAGAVSVSQPKLVRSLADAGMRVVQVSCGAYHTAAITHQGFLYTWGNGQFGRLGHGSTANVLTPRKVAGLQDHVVTHVSCGWWHTAAVGVARTSTQRLHLAHSHSALDDMAASSATPDEYGDVDGADQGRGSMNGEGSQLFSGTGSEADSQAAGGSIHTSAPLLGRRRRYSHHQETATPSDSMSGGGVLFTWGGDFTWVEPCEVRAHHSLVASAASVSPTALESPSSGGPPSDFKLSLTESDSKAGKGIARDHHRGCLGLGDLSGRLVPCPVKDDLQHEDVVQVACGWNLTVVLTRTGQVYQMGCTGAVNAEECRGGRPPSWEGARRPAMVDGGLFGLFIEEVSVGMHHVAVVGSRLHAGRLVEDGRRTRLFMWGKGKAGQLGLEQARDYSMPQGVPGIDGRRILHIACGGNHTLAVLEHEYRDAGRGRTSTTQLMASPAASTVLQGLGGYASNLTTPRVPSLQQLAPPRTSFPPPKMASVVVPLAASLRQSVPSAFNYAPSSATSWWGLGSSTRQPVTGPRSTSNVQDLRGSADERLSGRRVVRHTQSSNSSNRTVVGVPNARRASSRALEVLTESSLRGKTRLGGASSTGLSGAGSDSATGSRPTQSATRTPGRMGLVSKASSGALSTQSSPGIVGQDGGADLDPGSPRSSISASAFDPAGAELVLAPETSIDQDMSASAFEQAAYQAATSSYQAASQLQLPDELSCEESVLDLHQNGGEVMSPQQLNMSGLRYTDQPSAHQQPLNTPTSPWAFPPSTSLSQPGPRSPSASPRLRSPTTSSGGAAGLPAPLGGMSYPDPRLTRESSLSSWNAPVGMSRYPVDTDDDDASRGSAGGGALSPTRSSSRRHTQQHTDVLGMPLSLLPIRESRTEGVSGPNSAPRLDTDSQTPHSHSTLQLLASQGGGSRQGEQVGGGDRQSHGSSAAARMSRSLLLPDASPASPGGMMHDGLSAGAAGGGGFEGDTDTDHPDSPSEPHAYHTTLPLTSMNPAMHSALTPASPPHPPAPLHITQSSAHGNQPISDAHPPGMPAAALPQQSPLNTEEVMALNAALQQQVLHLQRQLELLQQGHVSSGSITGMQQGQVQVQQQAAQAGWAGASQPPPRHSHSRSRHSRSSSFQLHGTNSLPPQPLTPGGFLSPTTTAPGHLPSTSSAQHISLPSSTPPKRESTGSGPSIIRITSRRFDNDHLSVEHTPRTIGGIPVLPSPWEVPRLISTPDTVIEEGPQEVSPTRSDAQGFSPRAPRDEQPLLAGSTGHEGSPGLVDGPLVQLPHPFASAVATDATTDLSTNTASSSVAEVVSAAGPAMLRTKAASILEKRHRRAQSVDVSRLSLSLLASPYSSPPGEGFNTMPLPLRGATGDLAHHQPGVTRASPAARDHLSSNGDSHNHVGYHSLTRPTQSTSLPAAQHHVRGTFSPDMSQQGCSRPGGHQGGSANGVGHAYRQAGGSPTSSPAKGADSQEMWPGVHVYLQPNPETGVMEVVKVRFSRKHFTPEQATQWWLANHQLLADRYPLNLQLTHKAGRDSSTGSQGGPAAGQGPVRTSSPSYHAASGELPGSSLLPSQSSLAGPHSYLSSMSQHFSLPMEETGLVQGSPPWSPGAVAGSSPPGMHRGHLASNRSVGLPPLPRSHPANASPPDTGSPSHAGAPTSPLFSPTAPGALLSPGLRSAWEDPAFQADVLASTHGPGGFTGPQEQQLVTPPHLRILNPSATLPHSATQQAQDRDDQPGSRGSPAATVSIQARARPGHHRSRSGGPMIGGRAQQWWQ